MFRGIYATANGLSGVKSGNKFILGILLAIYLFIYVYIGAYFKVHWVDGVIPYQIMFDGRDISVTMYSSTLAVLFYIVFTIQVYWLSVQSEVFFNKTTMKIFHVNEISGSRLYLKFFIKRAIELFIIDCLFIFSIVLIYLVRDQALMYTLIQNLYVIFITSLFLIIIFDLIYYVSGKSSTASLMTIFIVIILSLVNFAVRPLMGYSKYSDLSNIIPDILSIAYQYLLLSFEASHSTKQIFYPLLILLICLIVLYKLSKNMLFKFSK